MFKAAHRDSWCFLDCNSDLWTCRWSLLPLLTVESYCYEEHVWIWRPWPSRTRPHSRVRLLCVPLPVFLISSSSRKQQYNHFDHCKSNERVNLTEESIFVMTSYHSDTVLLQEVIIPSCRFHLFTYLSWEQIYFLMLRHGSLIQLHWLIFLYILFHIFTSRWRAGGHPSPWGWGLHQPRCPGWWRTLLNSSWWWMEGQVTRRED